MKTNKIDKHIQEKLAPRVFQPSPSAWDRLSVQLEEQSVQKNKGWFFYIGYAASILALISLGIYFFSEEETLSTPSTIVVEMPVDTLQIIKKIEHVFKEIKEEAIVKNEEIVPENASKKNKVFKNTKHIVLKDSSKSIKIASTEIEKQTNINLKAPIKKPTLIKKVIVTKKNKNGITVNPDDLLFAVTHTSKEVKEYYAKYDISREYILKTIQSELKKSDLKINPETILAEVERTIDDDFFKNNFLNSLKKKITDIATLIASRND